MALSQVSRLCSFPQACEKTKCCDLLDLCEEEQRTYISRQSKNCVWITTEVGKEPEMLRNCDKTPLQNLMNSGVVWWD